MADEDVEFVEESEVSEGDVKEGKKYITSTLGVDTDADLIEEYDLLRTVGGFDNRAIVEAGVKALFKSEEFKKRAQKLKDVIN